MITVKKQADLDAMRGVKTKEPAKPDSVALLSTQVATMTAAMQDSTARTESVMRDSMGVLEVIAQKMNTPVEVTVQEPEKVRCWNFVCHYDKHDRLTNITAEAKE